MNFWGGFEKQANAYLKRIGAIKPKVAPAVAAAGAPAGVAGAAKAVAPAAAGAAKPMAAAAPKQSPWVNRIQADLRARHGGKKYIDIK